LFTFVSAVYFLCSIHRTKMLVLVFFILSQRSLNLFQFLIPFFCLLFKLEIFYWSWSIYQIFTLSSSVFYWTFLLSFKFSLIEVLSSKFFISSVLHFTCLYWIFIFSRCCRSPSTLRFPWVLPFGPLARELGFYFPTSAVLLWLYPCLELNSSRCRGNYLVLNLFIEF
jgi:hypothetical protein